jgi:hypothetical protein
VSKERERFYVHGEPGLVREYVWPEDMVIALDYVYLAIVRAQRACSRSPEIDLILEHMNEDWEKAADLLAEQISKEK